MFDLQRFVTKLHSQLSGTTVGYEFAVFHEYAFSTSGAGGFAVVQPQTQMTADRRTGTASMSKTITAAAFMRVIEILNQAGGNLTIDSKIAPYLPSAWRPGGQRVAETTFKDLLSHRSGLRGLGDADLFDNLRQTIANGSVTATSPEYYYQNCNFALFRILIPNVLYGVEVSDQPDNSALEAEIETLQAELVGASTEEKKVLMAQIKALQAKIDKTDPALRTAELYFNFVRQEVLGRVGLSTVSLAPQDAQEAALRYYKFGDTSHPYKDRDFMSQLLRVGPGGWYMSAKEFARFIAGLRSGQVVSDVFFQQMIGNDPYNLGIGSASESTRGGPNWDHVGEGGDVPMVGDWMILPDGWTTAILVNSQGGLKKSLQDVIRNAFNAAWLSPPITNSAPAAAALGSSVYAFLTADDNRLYINHASGGQPFNGWMEVEGNATTGVAPAVASLENRIYVFAKGFDNRVYVNSALKGQPFDGWGSGWSALPGMATDAALAATSLENVMYVFAKGLDTRVYFNSTVAGQAFGGWKEVDGGGTTDVGLGAASVGDRVYVFAKGIFDNRVYVNSALKGKPFDGWGSGWSALPGMTTDAAPAAASVGDCMYVFVKGLDTRIYFNSAVVGQAFGGWKEVDGGGTTDVALGAASLMDRIYVFGKGIGDSRVYVNSALKGQPFDGWGSGWSEVQW